MTTATTATPTATPAGEQAGGEGPLAGIRVLDLGTVYAAPITATMLGDYGADVLKIEHPRGDPAHTHGPSKVAHGPRVRPFGVRGRVAVGGLRPPRERQGTPVSRWPGRR